MLAWGRRNTGNTIWKVKSSSNGFYLWVWERRNVKSRAQCLTPISIKGCTNFKKSDRKYCFLIMSIFPPHHLVCRTNNGMVTSQHIINLSKPHHLISVCYCEHGDNIHNLFYAGEWNNHNNHCKHKRKEKFKHLLWNFDKILRFAVRINRLYSLLTRIDCCLARPASNY